jgi:hypothetical protein
MKLAPRLPCQVVDLYDAVLGRAEVVWRLGDQEYGTREFGVRDPDGYFLGFLEARTAWS